MIIIHEDNQTLKAIQTTKNEYKNRIKEYQTIIDELTEIELQILKRLGEKQ